jgi:hypothetical protein
VDLLDSKVGTKTRHQTVTEEIGELQVVDFIGGPSRTRTYDPLIMSSIKSPKAHLPWAATDCQKPIFVRVPQLPFPNVHCYSDVAIATSR